MTFRVSGAPQFINVTNSADLRTEWAKARGGEVITLTTVVPAFEWILDQSKPRVGVCVVMPPTQPLKLQAGVAELNTDFVGGTYSSFAFNGQVTPGGVAGYGISLTGATRFTFRNCYLGQSNNAIIATGCSDFYIGKLVNEFSVSDTSQFVGCSGFILDDWYGLNGCMRGEKIRVFGDGSAPIDNASGGTIAGSIWDDTPHNDNVQLRGASSNFIVENFYQEFLGQGASQLGPDSGLNNRMLMRNNTFLTRDLACLGGSGENSTVIDNIVGPHPTAPGPNTPTLTMTRRPEAPEARMQAGRNVALPGAAIVGSPATATRAAVDPGAAVVNGDTGVLLPTATAPNRLPWAPAAARPAFIPYTGLAELVIPQKIYSGLGNTFSINPTTTPVGRFLTMGLGTVRVFPTAREFRWLRNGVEIAGTHGNRVLATAGFTIGDVIVGQQRTTNGAGVSGWVSGVAVTLT